MENLLKFSNILILGMGKSGLSVYNFLAKQGLKNVYIWDDNSEVRKKYQHLNLQDYRSLNFSRLSLVVCSPGIALRFPQEHFLLKKSKEFGFEIICDIELFFRCYPNKDYIGVTGTNGKSTTASLIYHIFNSADKKVALGGNIGTPVFELNIKQCDIIILELSSYQLELMSSHKIRCSILLNIEPDHLEHHGNYDNYKHIKHKIFDNQSENDIAIVFSSYHNKPKNSFAISNIRGNKDDKIISYENGCLIDNYYEDNKLILNLLALQNLKGEHNYQNIAFSYACARFFNIDVNKIINSIKSFKGLSHRQQVVGKINDILFINDSKATNQQSTKQALLAFKNIYLILGGVEKEDNLDILIPLLSQVKNIFLIGQSTALFKNILSINGINCVEAITLQKALQLAYQEASENQDLEGEKTILLSPACASFDQFLNFEDRGQKFIELFETLKITPLNL